MYSRVSLRAVEVAQATIESVMRKLPKKGAKATYALSVLSRVDWIVRLCGSLILRAQCLANARGQCVNAKDARVCDVGCASIVVIEGLGELVVYRRTRDPLVVRLTPGGLSVSRKDSTITIEGARIKVEIQGGDGGRVERTVKLDEIEELLENDFLIRLSLKGVETRLSSILRNLANCAKLTATQCP